MSNSNPNNKDILARTYENAKAIAVLRSECKDIKEDIADIKDNHLKELNSKIDRLQWWIVLAIGGLAVNLAVLLLERM